MKNSVNANKNEILWPKKCNQKKLKICKIPKKCVNVDIIIEINHIDIGSLFLTLIVL